MHGDRIVVIGAGVAGLSTALQLAELGCSNVTVLEATHVAAGSSSLSVGMFTRAYLDPLDIQMRVWSHNYLAYLADAAYLPLRRIGYLRLARTPEALSSLAIAAEVQRSFGVTDAQVLDVDEIRSRYPHIRVDDRAGGLLLADDGYLDGAVLSNVYYQNALARGVAYHGRSKVEGFDHVGDAYRVLTSRGAIDADVIVNAAGPWAGRLAAMWGEDLGVVPQRHQAAVLRVGSPLGYPMPNVMDYVPGFDDDGVYFRHEGDSQLVAGVHTNEVEPGVDDDPDAFNPRGDAAFIERLAEGLGERLTDIEEIGVEAAWAGLYPMSRDGQALLGPTSKPGIYACAGLGGVGIHLSPAAGRLVAESIVFGEFRMVDDARRLMANRAVTA